MEEKNTKIKKKEILVLYVNVLRFILRLTFNSFNLNVRIKKPYHS